MSTESDLCELMVECRNDPLRFVQRAFPWGEAGTELAGFSGADEWQVSLLERIAREIKNDPFNGRDAVLCRNFAVVSGHGIGKSAFTAWIILWLMSTRPNMKGTVTAATSGQLRTRTWGELSKWWNLCITKDWFEYHNAPHNMSICHVEKVNEWRVDAVTCKDENSESFAGQHASSSSSVYIFDEASAVPDKIWDVSEGGKTDGEPFHFAFGNPTKKSGKFFECFNQLKSRWNTFKVDSRESSRTNKKIIDQWKQDHGEDSDFFKVRVRGEFPESETMQFIPSDAVNRARTISPSLLGNEPLICGIDAARGGEDHAIIQFRRGRDARSYKKLRIKGEVIADSMKFIDMIREICQEYRPDMIYVDETGLGGPIKDNLVRLGLPCEGVHFGNRALNNDLYLNRGSEMWFNMREWIMKGGAINPIDGDLHSQLTDRQFLHTNSNQLVIESKKVMKKRGIQSPDDADGLCLTFAHPDREYNFTQSTYINTNKPIVYRNPLDNYGRK